MTTSFENAYKAAAEPKTLVIIPNANHVDLYDKSDLIPFDRLTSFFKQYLKENKVLQAAHDQQ